MTHPDKLPAYSKADMNRQLEAWASAANALSAGDSEGICAALSHDGEPRDSAVVCREVLAMASLGAHLTAAQVMRVHTPPHPPSPGHKHVLEARSLDPGHEPSATERVAIHAVLLASTHDFPGVLNLVAGYGGYVMDAASLQRIADLIMELLRMYVVYAQMDTPQPLEDSQ